MKIYCFVFLMALTLVGCSKDESEDSPSGVNGGLNNNVDQDTPCLIEAYFKGIHNSFITDGYGFFSDISMFQNLTQDLTTYDSYSLYINYASKIYNSKWALEYRSRLNQLSSFNSPDVYSFKMGSVNPTWHLEIKCYHKRASEYFKIYNKY